MIKMKKQLNFNTISKKSMMRLVSLILFIGVFLFIIALSLAGVSAVNLLTKVDFEISRLVGIDNLNNSNGTSVLIGIINSSGSVIVSRNATAGVYLENMTITMSGDKFNLSYSTNYTYNLSTAHGNFLFNFTTPSYSAGSIITSWDDDKSYFVNNGDSTVTDTYNNLMWQDGCNGATLNWTDAISYCDGLSLAGYDDWRLPNLGEWLSIIKGTYAGSSFYPSAFAGSKCNYYWTSTENPAYTADAYYVDVDVGGVGNYGKGYGYGSYARCVRS